MNLLDKLSNLIDRLVGLRAIEKRVERLAKKQATMKGDVRQMQQKANSLRRLVETMRREKDWTDD